MIDYEKLLKDPAFGKLEPGRVAALMEVMNKISGKSPMESMPIIMEFMKKTPQGKPLSKHEQAAMVRVMMENLPDNERVKFTQMLSVIETMGS